MQGLTVAHHETSAPRSQEPGHGSPAESRRVASCSRVPLARKPGNLPGRPRWARPLLCLYGGSCGPGAQVATAWDYNPQLCLWLATNNTVTLSTCENDTSAQRAASGSGRLINVQSSSENDQLEFLNSSSANGGNPHMSINACPAACWSNVDH